jgi:threonyl-tRNA synthetase
MREIVEATSRSRASAAAATRRSSYFKGMGEHYKAEIIGSIPATEDVSLYRAGRLHRPVPRPARAQHRQAARRSS